MILFYFIITFFRLILQQLIILFQGDDFYLLLIKLFIGIVLSSILYYLYNYYKYDYKFSKKYALNTIPKISNTFIILSLYYGIFIIGFLFVRFYNVDKTLNLYVNINLLIDIIKATTYINIITTCYFLFILIIMFKYIYHLFSQYIKFHKNCAYYFTFIKNDSFETIFWFISNNLTIKNLLKIIIIQNIAYILYFLGFIHIDKKQYNPSYMPKFSAQVYDHLPRYARIFTSFLYCKAFVLHYYVLFIVFFYDIFYNFYILENVYKIMPYIFIYELVVRMSKTIIIKNRDYDDFLAYYLYATCFENNQDIITLGNRTWTQEEAYDIIADYAFNNFMDKHKIQFFLRPYKYDPFKIYDTSYFQISENIHKMFKKNYVIIIVFLIVLILYS